MNGNYFGGKAMKKKRGHKVATLKNGTEVYAIDKFNL